MLDFKNEPFNGYVYLHQLGNEVPNTSENKQFILGCNYAIRLLKEIDKNLDALFEGISKILQEKPHITNEIYEDCFWLSDRIFDILKKLLNLFKRFTRRTGVAELALDAGLQEKVKIIRDNQTHLEEKLLIDELTSYFRLNYLDNGCSMEMKLDNQLPYYIMTLPDTGANCNFNPSNLSYKILNSLDQRNRNAAGEVEVDFLSLRKCVDDMYLFLKENMKMYVADYRVSCPAPTQLSVVMS